MLNQMKSNERRAMLFHNVIRSNCTHRPGYARPVFAYRHHSVHVTSCFAIVSCFSRAPLSPASGTEYLSFGDLFETFAARANRPLFWRRESERFKVHV